MNFRQVTYMLTAITAVTFSTSGLASGPKAEYDFTAMNSELSRQCRSGEFAGVVLVRAHGQDVYEMECGQADSVNLVPVTRATRFRIHSTSKMLTALTIMRMVEKGTMGLDRSIADYIPDAPTEWRAVTIRSLLNHTSGIPDYTEQMLYQFRVDQPTAMRLAIAAFSPDQRKLNSKPGERFSYNNFGFELLADAAAHVSGLPFAQLVQDLVLTPAGMKTASIERPNIVDGHPVGVNEAGLAFGYNGSPGKLEQSIPWSFIQLGAGAARASVDDFVALDEALSSGKIVSPKVWASMTTKGVNDPSTSRKASDSTFGLGVIMEERDGVRLQGHTGGTNGFISDFERFPNDDAMMIVLSNRGFTRTVWIREGVAKALKRAR